MQSRLPILVFALVMAAIPFIPGMPPFWIVLLDNIGLAALVAMGLVLLTGVGGLTSFGQAAFVGFGAYTTALLTTAYGLSPWLTLPLSLLVSGLLAVLLGRRGTVMTHRELLREVWGPAHSDSSHYLRIYMGHLRHKLERDPARPEYLLTEVGVGYRFTA